MNIKSGVISLGSVGVSIEATVDATLTPSSSYSIILRKPSGGSLKVAASVVGNVAQYITVADDIDEIGVWYGYLRNETTGFEYEPVSNSFTVRPNAEDM